MRKTSAAVQAVLDSSNIVYFHLVKVGPFLDPTTGLQTIWRHTHLPGGININGEEYTDDNTLMHIDTPRQSAAVDREPFKIAYEDSSFTLRPIFENGFTGVPVTVQIGFYSAAGVALTAPADLVTVYRGTTDTIAYNTDLRENTIVSIECTSPMGALLMTRTLLTNKETLKQLNPLDTAYDEIFVGSKGISLLWGKKD